MDYRHVDEHDIEEFADKYGCDIDGNVLVKVMLLDGCTCKIDLDRGSQRDYCPCESAETDVIDNGRCYCGLFYRKSDPI